MRNQKILNQQQIVKPSPLDLQERAEPFRAMITQLQQSSIDPQQHVVVQQGQQQLEQVTSQQQLQIPMTPHILQQLSINHLEGQTAQQIQQQLIYPTADMNKVMYQRFQS